MKKTRAHNDHLSQEDKHRLLEAWEGGVSTPLAAALVNCSARIVQKYYGLFRTGWRPTTSCVGKPRATSESAYFGPVKKVPMSAPNCIPSVAAKIRAGRA